MRYTFDIMEFIKQIPGIEGYEDAARDFLHRMPQVMLDNVGEADEHRAVNYLTLRYQAVYNMVASRLKLNQTLKGMTASPTVGARKPPRHRRHLCLHGSPDRPDREFPGPRRCDGPVPVPGQRNATGVLYHPGVTPSGRRR
jgi:hypothetical protein